jgi:hypothetical protein
MFFLCCWVDAVRPPKAAHVVSKGCVRVRLQIVGFPGCASSCIGQWMYLHSLVASWCSNVATQYLASTPASVMHPPSLQQRLCIAPSSPPVRCSAMLSFLLQHMLPNFNECWWDSWLLDVAICNSLGEGQRQQFYMHMHMHTATLAHCYKCPAAGCGHMQQLR